MHNADLPDRAAAEALAADLLRAIVAHSQRRPAARSTVLEILNALAGSAASVILGTEGHAKAFFDRALDQQLEDLGGRFDALSNETRNDETADLPDLGACCGCGRNDVPVGNIVMLDVKGQVPGHGWGCVACHLPSDGASAVLCDDCIKGFMAGRIKLQFACRGFPGQDGRVPIGELTVPHRHDPDVDHDA